MVKFLLKRLLLGMMSITGFISLWISNTATTSMMLPIVVEVARQLIIANRKTFENKMQVGLYRIKEVTNDNNLVIEMVKSEEKENKENDSHDHSSEEELFETKSSKQLMTCLLYTSPSPRD